MWHVEVNIIPALHHGAPERAILPDHGSSLADACDVWPYPSRRLMRLRQDQSRTVRCAYRPQIAGVPGTRTTQEAGHIAQFFGFVRLWDKRCGLDRQVFAFVGQEGQAEAVEPPMDQHPTEENGLDSTGSPRTRARAGYSNPAIIPTLVRPHRVKQPVCSEPVYCVTTPVTTGPTANPSPDKVLTRDAITATSRGRMPGNSNGRTSMVGETAPHYPHAHEESHEQPRGRREHDSAVLLATVRAVNPGG